MLIPYIRFEPWKLLKVKKKWDLWNFSKVIYINHVCPLPAHYLNASQYSLFPPLSLFLNMESRKMSKIIL